MVAFAALNKQNHPVRVQQTAGTKRILLVDVSLGSRGNQHKKYREMDLMYNM